MSKATLYIGIIMLFRVVQAIFSKQSSNEVKNVRILVVYSTYRMAISSAFGLALILIAGNGFHLDWKTVLIASFSGIMLFLSGACSIFCMKSGTVSLDSMFGTAGMLIPMFAGIFLFNQPVRPLQWGAVAIFFVSAWLLVRNSKKTYTNFSFKTVLLLAGSLLSNGCTMLAQQLFTQTVPDGDVSAFTLISFGVIAILGGIVSLILLTNEKRTGNYVASDFRLSKKLLLCGFALATAVFVINQLATLSTALVSPVVLFAFINGGGTIIATVVAAILYREKLTPSSVIGVLLGIASLVMIKLF